MISPIHHRSTGRDRDPEDGGPLYCPRCGQTGPAGSTVCGDCGETMRAQGYCDVCEAYWALPPGIPCPKHERPLYACAPDDEAGLTSPPALGQAWVTVATFGDALGAEAPRIRLEAEGIPTFLDGERMGGPSMYPLATGGVKLQVPESLTADARILLAQSWSPPKLDTPDDDLDDAWEELGPDSGAIWRDLCRLAILVGLLAPVLFSLLVLLFEGIRRR
jgi:hypothetical protein